MTAEVNSIKAFFASIEVFLSDIWLESCINWCKSEALPPSYTPKELQAIVYEQWLLLDLRDVEISILPRDLSSKQHFTLAGNFCLQMMKIVDISKPKLWQLQKIRNSNALTRGTQQDADVAGTGKRLLQITLTDGVQEVEAMEYQPVPCLSLNLAPGVKVRILGPVVVRRGRLMLEPQNVKVLGGEVQELLVANAAENVLAKHLKLPENPNPAAIQEKLLVVEKEEKSEGYVSNLPPRKPKNNTNPQPAFTDDFRKLAPQKQDTFTAHDFEDEFMSQEIDMLLEAEAECQRLQSEQRDMFYETKFDVSRSNTSTQVLPKPTRAQESSMLLDEDEDVFRDIDLDAHLDKLDNLIVPKPNIITIAKLLELKSNISKGVFKIQAKFKGVEEKLTLSDGEYKLAIKVTDASGALIVKVHSDVIAAFAECSPDDVISLKSDVLGMDEAAIQRMMNTIMKVKDKLLVLDNVVAVQIEKGKPPVMTKVL